MKKILLVLTFCLLLSIFCHAINKPTLANYTHEYYTLDRINVGYSSSLYKGLLAETTSFNVTRIGKDSWNDFKDNYSIASLLPSVIGYFVSTSYSDSTSQMMKNLIVALPILTNSMIYYPIIKSNSTAAMNFNIAPFIKNDTDVFMFRRAIWGQLTPGAGLRVYFGNAIRSSIDVGVERSLQSDFVEKKATKDLYFIRMGINMNVKK